MGSNDQEHSFRLEPEAQKNAIRSGLGFKQDFRQRFGSQLPKLEVPIFNGNLMNWAAFWERFDSLVHCRKGVDDVEKLTYFRQALKDVHARHMKTAKKLQGSYQMPPRAL